MKIFASKRGLLKSFIIVGILLLLLVLSFVFVQQKIQQNLQEKIIEQKLVMGNKDLSSDVIIVKNYIERCLEKSASAGIFLLGINGGYIYQTTSPTLQTEYATISFGLIDGKQSLPSIAHMENEISLYVEDSFNSCINNFVIFSRRDYNITMGKTRATTNVEKSDIRVFLEAPVTIKKDGMEYWLDNFAAIIPIRLGYLVETANEIIGESEDEGIEALGFEFFQGFDPYVTLLQTKSNETVVALHDKESVVDGEEFEFFFAIE